LWPDVVTVVVVAASSSLSLLLQWVAFALLFALPTLLLLLA